VKPVEDRRSPNRSACRSSRKLILPASAVIGLQVETPTTTERARVEDRVDARVSRDVMAAGRVAIPAGSRVIGSVTLVERGGKVQGTGASSAFASTRSCSRDGTEVPLHTEQVLRLGDAPARRAARRSAAPRSAARSSARFSAAARARGRRRDRRRRRHRPP
jgi:hypothetical protein